LHFLLLGALLFAAAHWRGTEPTDDSVIVVDAHVKRALVNAFQSRNDRAPTPDELA
jgi:hypothetical protein